MRKSFLQPTTYLVFLLFLMLLTSCDNSDDRSPVSETNLPETAAPTIDFTRQVAPVLHRRCAVCHGCYDAPCQLKLSSLEGLRRGANKTVIYNGTRLTADPLTRLFVDATSVSAWREKDFFPVLTEQKSKSQDSVMHRMLMLKQKNPLPVEHNQKLPPEAFEFKLARENNCPTQDEMGDFEKAHPLHGMPFGLPALESSEQDALLGWLESGANSESTAVTDPIFRQSLDSWESFLNGDTNKERLIARYVYEHLFFAHLYFSDISESQWFELVRSTTPPGEAIRIIATRRPFDDPAGDASINQNIERVYYRLRPVNHVIVAKNHMPYALNSERLQRFEALFLEKQYTVETLPGYSPDLAANPFETFKALPSRSRYRFLIEHSKFTIQGFMKGTVCRGQVALNVINDRFWVFFANPDEKVFSEWNEQLPRQFDRLDLPAERSSTAGLLAHWIEYSDSQSTYLSAKSQLFERVSRSRPPSLEWVWDGDGHNENASLTVFRHFDSASVVKGLAGQTPKTVWLIDYPILERIHYLLVAGFDVYGNAGHQLATRLYMDFLRMESEFNFLALLPHAHRLEVRDHWYRDADDQVLDYVYGDYATLSVEPEIDFPPEISAKQGLLKRLKSRLHPVLPESHALTASNIPAAHQPLIQLLALRGGGATIMPEMSLLMVPSSSGNNALYTILRDSAHSNITSLFLEKSNRLPEEDQLTILPGVVGAYPDVLWRVAEDNLSEFVRDLNQLDGEAGFSSLMGRYGIRRSHREFWSHSDALHLLYRQTEPVEYGILDFNRLENR